MPSIFCLPYCRILQNMSPFITSTASQETEVQLCSSGPESSRSLRGICKVLFAFTLFEFLQVEVLLIRISFRVIGFKVLGV